MSHFAAIESTLVYRGLRKKLHIYFPAVFDVHCESVDILSICFNPKILVGLP